MSHFTVTVAVQPKDGQDVSEALEALMAPFDEGLEVPEYRDYETGNPSEYWLYSAVKRAAWNVANGTGIKPYKPDEIGWSSESSKKTPEQQQAELEREAALFHAMPAVPTWADIVKLHDDMYPDSDDGDTLYLEEETGRAYTLTRYNPEAKWDYWRIGGRWGGYFATTGFDAYAACATWAPRRDWDSPKQMQQGWVDGGLKRHLDFDAMRRRNENEARNAYAKWAALTDGLPEAEPWSAFAERGEKAEIDLPEGDIAAKRALWAKIRKEYGAQPRVAALKGSDIDQFDCSIAYFQKPEEVFVELARARAVPGFATLTADGKWMAPGRMGWFAMTDATESTRIGYWEVANAYLESLPDDVYVFALDCHI